MEIIAHPAARAALAALLCGAALWAGVRGARHLREALGRGGPPDRSRRLVRGIRSLILGTGALLLAGGALLGSRRLLALGAIFLAEEIYETGVVLLALRAGGKARERGEAAATSART